MASSPVIRYEPLPAVGILKRKALFTRLLWLAPGSAEEPLGGHLSIVNAAAAPEPYEALSYCWGTEPPSAILRLGDQELPIRPNLEAALRALRLSTTSRVLWIDAICIDQSNVDERTRQVSYMRSVYEHALSVLAWVGPESPGVKLAFEAMESFARMRDQRAERRRQGYITTAEEAERAILDVLEQMPADTANQVLEFWQRPYFSRCWCVQEILANPRVWLKCGELQIAFVRAAGCIMTLGDLRSEVEPNTSGRIWYKILDKKLWDSTNILDNSLGAMLDVLDQMHSLSATDVRDKIYTVSSMCYEGIYPLYSLIPPEWMRGRRSMAWLHLLSAVTTKGMAKLGIGLDFLVASEFKPDYHKPAIEVYTGLVRFILHRSRGSLSVLDYVWHHDNPDGNEYPSWVPRWFEPKSAELFTVAYKFRAGCYPATFLEKWKLSRSPKVEDPSILTLGGLEFDKVHRTSDALFYRNPDTELVLGLFEKAWSQLFFSSLTPPSKLKYRDGQPLDLAFCKALCLYPFGILLGQAQKDYIFDDPPRAPRYHLVDEDLSIPQEFLSVLNSFRLLGSTSSFPSDPCFKVFMNPARIYSFDRRVFVTQEGRLGLGPKAMLPEDEIVVLKGGKMPFVVRRHEGRHLLIGQCYVVDDEVMNGSWAKERIESDKSLYRKFSFK